MNIPPTGPAIGPDPNVPPSEGVILDKGKAPAPLRSIEKVSDQMFVVIDEASEEKPGVIRLLSDVRLIDDPNVNEQLKLINSVAKNVVIGTSEVSNSNKANEASKDNGIVRVIKKIFEKIGDIFSSDKDYVINLKAENLKENKSSLITKIRQFIGSRFFYDRTEKKISAEILKQEARKREGQERFYEKIINSESGQMAVKDSLNGININLSPVRLEFEGEKIEVPYQFSLDAHRSAYVVNNKEIKFFDDSKLEEKFRAFKNFNDSLGGEIRSVATSVLNQSLLADIQRHLMEKLYQSGSEAFGLENIVHFGFDQASLSMKTRYEVENSDSELRLNVLYPVKITAYVRGQDEGDLVAVASLTVNVKREVTIPKLTPEKIDAEKLTVVDTYSHLTSEVTTESVTSKLINGKELDNTPHEIPDQIESEQQSVSVPESFWQDVMRSSGFILNDKKYTQKEFRDNPSALFNDIKNNLDEGSFALTTRILNQKIFQDTTKQIQDKFGLHKKPIVASQHSINYEIQNFDNELKLIATCVYVLTPEEEASGGIDVNRPILHCAVKREVSIPKSEISKLEAGNVDPLDLKIVDSYSKYRRLPEEAEAYIKYA